MPTAWRHCHTDTSSWVHSPDSPDGGGWSAKERDQGQLWRAAELPPSPTALGCWLESSLGLEDSKMGKKMAIWLGVSCVGGVVGSFVLNSSGLSLQQHIAHAYTAVSKIV